MVKRGEEYSRIVFLHQDPAAARIVKAKGAALEDRQGRLLIIPRNRSKDIPARK